MKSFKRNFSIFLTSLVTFTTIHKGYGIVRTNSNGSSAKLLLPELNELEYYSEKSNEDEGFYIYTDNAGTASKSNNGYLNDDFPDYKLQNDDLEPVEAAVEKGLVDSIRDTLGFPKFSFKLPFLKGRFSLAAKLLPEEKNDDYNFEIKQEPAILESFRKRIKSSYPGTLWCADGNIFRVKQDYGQFYKADVCCKNHDKCPYKIESGESWNQLKNIGIHERYHCDCDKDFFDCLKVVNTVVSNKLGYTYFNIFKPQCFRQDHPIIGCTKRLHNKCLTYVIDDSKNKTWQWFDNKFF